MGGTRDGVVVVPETAVQETVVQDGMVQEGMVQNTVQVRESPGKYH